MKNKTHRILLVLLLIVSALTLCGCGKDTNGENLLRNGELLNADSSGIPAGWYSEAWYEDNEITKYETTEGILHIRNITPNDARIVQDVKVEPNSLYLFHGYIRANAIGGKGANLSIDGIYAFSECLYDEKEWKEVSYYGMTGPDQNGLSVLLRLGGYSGESSGEAWFKDISFRKVSVLPEGSAADNWFISNTDKVSETAGGSAIAQNGMLIIAVSAFVYIVLGIVLMSRYRNFADNRGLKAFEIEKRNTIKLIIYIACAAVGIVIRIIVAFGVFGYDVDIGCFTAWTDGVRSIGTSDFYAQIGFCDYPPGYVLILWLVSLLGPASSFTVKLPPILCDMIISGVLLKEGKKHVSLNTGILIAVLYIFNPVTILTGAAWGQCDAVMTCALIVSLVMLMNKRWDIALPIYTFSVLLKPQALMFGPFGVAILIYDYIYTVKQGKDTEKHEGIKELIIRSAVGAMISAGIILIMWLLFTDLKALAAGDIHWDWMFSMYGKTMSQYGYITVNSCNVYFLLGENWLSADTSVSWREILLCSAIFIVPLLIRLKRNDSVKRILTVCVAVVVIAAVICIAVLTGGNKASSFGMAMIAVCIAVCVCLMLCGKERKHIPLLGALLLILVFNTGSMMHERYLFPTIALLLLAYFHMKDRRIIWLAIAISVFSLFNIGCVLDRNIRIGGAEGHLNAPLCGIESDTRLLEYLSSVGNYLTAVFALWLSTDICCDGHIVEAAPVFAKAGMGLAEKQLLSAHGGRTGRLEIKDKLIILTVTCLYTVMALVNLGSTKAPQTYYISNASEDMAVYDIGEERSFDLLYFSGIQWQDYYTFNVSVSRDGVNWSQEYTAESHDGDCFAWKYVPTEEMLTGRYIRLNMGDIPGLWLNEIVVRDETGANLPIKMIRGSEGMELLCDEPDSLEGEPGWWNSTYFDEIYHARTAYEHLHGLRTYETSHPPLGKVIMSLGIALFGMCPFGWRFMGALCGVFMLPAIYLLARLIIKQRKYAICAILIFAADLMHFTQTRIATIDSYVVLFILWSIYFMWYWMKQDYFRLPYWRTFIPLGLSGLFMGLSVASKWTGCYNGVGLAVLFFGSVIFRFVQVSKARNVARDHENLCEYDEEAQQAIISAADHGAARICGNVLSCLLFFIAVPLLIYYVSYIPYFSYSGGVTVRKVIEAAVGKYFTTGEVGGMLGYHSTPGLGMDHFFYSPWYEWPLDIKPMWFYSDIYSKPGTGATIMTMGNPAVWWGGLIGVLILTGMALFRMLTRINGRYSAISPVLKEDNSMLFLLISFAAQFLPWVPVPRGTYIYHYFACVPIIILSLMYVISVFENIVSGTGIPVNDAIEKQKINKKKLFTGFLIAYTAICIILFVAFFPYASGVSVSTSWLDAMNWFSNWLYY